MTARAQTSPQTVLFLCTGNYYRSRFAEELFNHEAQRRNLPARAESRGLAIELGIHNVGAISKDALAGLRQRNVVPVGAHRTPSPVTAGDFGRADRVIAVHEPEHRPMMIDRHPAHVDAIEYWHVPDVGELDVKAALQRLGDRVMDLIDQMQRRAAD